MRHILSPFSQKIFTKTCLSTTKFRAQSSSILDTRIIFISRRTGERHVGLLQSRNFASRGATPREKRGAEGEEKQTGYGLRQRLRLQPAEIALVENFSKTFLGKGAFMKRPRIKREISLLYLVHRAKFMKFLILSSFLPSSSSLRHIQGCIDSIGEPDAARDFFRVGGSLA